MPAGLPNYLPSAYVEAISMFGTGSLRFEQRKDAYGALAALIASSPGLISETAIQTDKQSFDRPFSLPVIKRFAATLIDGRACLVAGSESTTDKVSITFTTKGFAVKVPTRQNFKNNYFTYEQLLANGMYASWHAWYQFMENGGLAFLEANKASQTSLVDTPDYFTKTAGAYVGVKGKNFYEAYQYTIGRNLLNSDGDLIDVASSNAKVTKIQMTEFGAQNSQNLAGLIGGSEFYPTNFLIPGTGFSEAHYVFPRGTAGVYFWVSPNAVANYVHVPQRDFWFTEKDPMFNYFTASVHYQESCQDQTVGTAGASEPIYYDKYEYTIDPSFVKAYTSVAGESPIIKFNLTAS